MQKTIIFIAFLFLGNLTNGQVVISPKKIYGKVVANYNDLEGIYIINQNTEKATLTERGGYFSINASVGDTLVFSAVQFKSIKVAIKEKDFKNELFFVEMNALVRLLDEVRINEYKNINAVSLGIISPNTKHYTPAERKLRTASNAYPTLGAGTSVGFSAGLDPVMNWLSGRTAMLEKEVEVEKKEFLLEKVNNLFDENYFLVTLKIPEDYVKGFKYYIVEDTKFVEAVNGKNKTMATFIMNELAVRYKNLIK